MVCFMIHSPERKSGGMILALVGAERNTRNVAAGITEKVCFDLSGRSYIYQVK